MATDDEIYEKLKGFRKRADLSLKPTKYLRETFFGYDGVERPIKLRYYQVQAVLHLLAMRRFLLGDDTGLGKCLSRGNLIRTGRGFLPIEDLNPGIETPDTFAPLVGETVIVGEKSLPIKGFYNGGEKPTLKIKTYHGYEEEGTLVHPIRVRREGGEQWVKLSELQLGDYVCLDRSLYPFGKRGLKLPSPGAQNGEVEHTLPQEMTPKFARFLAYLTGEGWFNRDNFCYISQCGIKNPEVCEDIEELLVFIGYKVNKTGTEYSLASTQIIRFLQLCGVTQGISKDKEIPWSIFQADRESVRHFVRALIDAESHVTKDGVEFSSASEKLVKQLQVILLGFGIISRKTPKKVKSYPQNKYWRLTILGEDARIYARDIGFVSKRKEEAASALFAHKSNPNNDLVPHFKETMTELRTSVLEKSGNHGFKGGGIIRKIGVSLYNAANQIKYGKRNASFRFLNRFLAVSKELGLSETESYLATQEICDQHYFYDPVVSIEEGFAQVYDLTVDDPSHTFIGNGFVNHNTLMSISALCYIWAKNPDERAIILTDKSAVPQWKAEFERFTDGVSVFTVDGPLKKREKAYAEYLASTGPTVLITNYRKPVMDFEFFQPLEGYTLITDEATAYKNPKTQTHQSCKYMSGRASRVWALTATLIKNNLLEGFGIYRVLVPKLFPNKMGFIKTYTINYMQPVPGTGRKVPIIKGYKKSHIDAFKAKIDPYFIGRPKFEVASELPTLTTKHITVGLSRGQSQMYEEALSGLLQVGEGDKAEDKEVTMLTSLIYCQQIVNHPALIEREGKSLKLEELLDILSEGDLSDEKIIIFTRFRKMVDIIAPLLNELHKDKKKYCVRVTGDENGDQRHESMTLFQDPSSDTRVVIITMAGAAAINLQAAKAIIFYDSPWSAGDYLQILGRMIRIGSIHDMVYAIHLIAQDAGKPTIDGRTQDVLLSKMELIERVLGKRLKTETEGDYEVSAEDDMTDLFRILRQDAQARLLK